MQLFMPRKKQKRQILGKVPARLERTVGNLLADTLTSKKTITIAILRSRLLREEEDIEDAE